MGAYPPHACGEYSYVCVGYRPASRRVSCLSRLVLSQMSLHDVARSGDAEALSRVLCVRILYAVNPKAACLCKGSRSWGRCE